MQTDIATLEELRDWLRNEVDPTCGLLEYADAIDRLLTERAKMVTIPSGWKLVPELPSEEMIAAGYERLCDGNLPPVPMHWEGWITPQIYTDMLAAAPQPPKASADE